ncbi:MAG: LutB/LldF family L-lactate oxidation iron-sulfur protein [Nitrospinaceae bacterium]|nr:LutB/LldF family L-lactate oxidation iron-sulfur protein [Nitrospinaceae bacterium]
MPHNILSEKTFLEDTSTALKNQQLRRNFKRAMNGLMEKRRGMFPDTSELEELRGRAGGIRRKTLAHFPELLEQLEANCERKGIRVHWAETTEQANRIVLEIARSANVRLAVKGKSMVSEEMHLNAFLEEHGIEVIESDLGEYIIQVVNELPSHIIMPAIHKNLDEIADLFHEKVDPNRSNETAEEMTATARLKLRQKFQDADMGISGVNFAVAETGTLCLVENEGNGRFSTTLPKVHVAVMGIEKVVESLHDLPPLLTMLPRSATGQPITTYFNMISSPRREGELDGPEEVHLVLLDHGRSEIYEDELLRETLLCIRCGACMNHCPVYTRIGGHAYNAVYPGPIGKIFTPQIEGIESAGYLANASSLCGACVEVCPVKIPITDILLRLRRNHVRNKNARHWTDLDGGKSLMELMTWKGWKQVLSQPGLYRTQSSLLSRIGNLLPAQMPVLRQWARSRSLPRFSKKPLHRLVEEAGIDHE